MRRLTVICGICGKPFSVKRFLFYSYVKKTMACPKCGPEVVKQNQLYFMPTSGLRN